MDEYHILSHLVLKEFKDLYGLEPYAMPVLSKLDLLRYPFTIEFEEYLKSNPISLSDLMSPEYSKILKDSELLLKEVILTGRIAGYSNIFVYPLVRFIVEYIKSDYLLHRFATSESKRIEKLLKDEPLTKILHIAKTSLNWNVVATKFTETEKIFGPRIIEFKMHFSSFLDASVYFSDTWKLVNRYLIDGYVYLNKDELVRLISEKVKFRIISKRHSLPRKIPEQLQEVIERIKLVLNKHIAKHQDIDLTQINEEAFPPCIKLMINETKSGHGLAHQARFAMTSFLLKIGMSIDDILNLFSSSPDFDPEIARYQIEHIAGLRGSRTPYTPPSCSYLRTIGLCVPDDELCDKISHPLNYYKRKLKKMKGGKSNNTSVSSK